MGDRRLTAPRQPQTNTAQVDEQRKRWHSAHSGGFSGKFSALVRAGIPRELRLHLFRHRWPLFAFSWHFLISVDSFLNRLRPQRSGAAGVGSFSPAPSGSGGPPRAFTLSCSKCACIMVHCSNCGLLSSNGSNGA